MNHRQTFLNPTNTPKLRRLLLESNYIYQNAK